MVKAAQQASGRAESDTGCPIAESALSPRCTAAFDTPVTAGARVHLCLPAGPVRRVRSEAEPSVSV